MATTIHQQELHKTIWDIANNLRGKVDGWDFKAYVLGTLFYRYISENLTEYINQLQAEAGIENFDYAELDDETAQDAVKQMVEEKGYFILPSQLFKNVAKNAAQDQNLNETLSKIFRAIEASAIGTPAEDDLKGLFSDFIVDNTKLGANVTARNSVLAKVLTSVAGMEISGVEGASNDVFGDAYEFLMQMYAAGAGKSGGEFFTPQEVSEVLSRIAAHGNPDISHVYDPACGSGSLLLKFRKTVGAKNEGLKYYGQEVNPTTYNLCRINMFLHNVDYNNFDIRLGDTLLQPLHLDQEFDAIVSNPPYSLKWDGKDKATLINDERYSPAGVLAPKSAADLAFTMHMLHHLKETGTCAIVEFPGVLYRGGAEKAIREYLIKGNFVDTVIQLPANLFFGVGIATCIIVLRKGNRPDSRVLFMDASALCQKQGNKNVLLPEHQYAIVEAYANRKEIQYFTRIVENDDILANDCNLSVSSYVEQEDKREVIDIKAVNKEIETVVAQNQELRAKIDEFIKSL